MNPWRVRIKIEEPGRTPWYREVVVMAENGMRAVAEAARQLDADYMASLGGA